MPAASTVIATRPWEQNKLELSDTIVDYFYQESPMKIF